MIQQNFEQYFRSLLILFAALLMGQVVVTGILYFTMTPAPVVGDEVSDPMQYVVPVAVLLLIGLGFFLSKNRIDAARGKDGFIEKFELYRSASILRWATVEGSTLMTVVLYFFGSGRPVYLGLTAICILYFVTLLPAREKIIRELDLTAAEQVRLNNPNEIVAEQRTR